MPEKPDQEKPKDFWKIDLVIGYIERISVIIKSLVLPGIFIFIIIQFHEPLGKIAHMLPIKLDHANKVSAGGLSFEIEKSAKAEGNPELSKLINGLSRRALQILLETPVSSSKYNVETWRVLAGTAITNGEAMIHYEIPSESEINAFKELESAHLLVFNRPIDQWISDVDKILKLSYHSENFDSYVTENGQPEVDKEGMQLLESFKYKHSHLGKKAVNMIIHSVSNELHNSANSEPI